MDSNKLTEILIAKVDKLDARIDSIDVTLAKQHKSLELHMLRTDLNEEQLKLMRQEAKPVQRHVAMIEGGLKAFGAISAILGILKLLGLI